MPTYAPKPNPDARAEQIKRLGELQAVVAKKVPRSQFGDDNLAALRAQIEVAVHDLSDERIGTRFGHNDYIYDCACEMRLWLDGKYEVMEQQTSPAAGWAALTA